MSEGHTTIATNGLFVSRRPVARPDPEGDASEPENDTMEGAAPEPPPTIVSQAQIPTVAAANGNPLVLFGGDEGFEPGEYRVTLRPTVRHGKLRIHPTAITAAEDAEREEGYKIIDQDGVVPTELTDDNTTDKYLQVPDTTTVETDWSEDIQVPCMPKTVDFRCTDFKANPFQNNRSEGRLRTLHPKARHTFFCFVNKCEELDREYVVLSGLRGPAEQDELYCRDFRTSTRNKSEYCLARGFTDGRQPNVSNAAAWQSNHNYGNVIDMQDFNVSNWVSRGIPSQLAGTIGDAFGLEWVARWNNPDYPHFQLSTPSWRTLRDARSDADRIFTYDGNEYVSY